MVKLILFFVFFRVDPNPPVIDTFDMLEVNHKCNDYGVPNMDQVIAWDWSKRDRKFHCQWWKDMGKSSREKTKEGEKEWLKKRRAIADNIRQWPQRKHWLDNTPYRGEYVGGIYQPVKNWRTGYWEIKFDNRIVRAKIFRETHTNYDPEVEDRKEFNQKFRRGLRKLPINKTSILNNKTWQEFIEGLVPQFNN